MVERGVRLHLDADTSMKLLWRALLDRGHDVTRTPNDWVAAGASDAEQLLAATAQGRCLFTFNVRDFVVLAAGYPHHGGIVLAAQSSWRPPALISALDRMLRESTSADLVGQVLWLNQWRDPP